MSSQPDPVLRPNVEQANIAALRDAYNKLQALSGTDNRSWIYWAEYHGFNRYDCWHHARSGPSGTEFSYDLFLPWHRAYLVSWDHVTRDQNPDAILPWWDWTSDLSHQVGIPQAYSEDPVDGNRNSLASGPTPDMPDDPARYTRRFPGDPGELPSMTAQTPSNPAIETLLSLTSFVDFSNQLQDVHDFIHGWSGGTDPNNPNAGGDMGNIGVAAFDPIFWAHHAMIDRLWYLWQLRQGANNVPANYMSQTLSPFPYTVQQVLDVHGLGYDYASSSTGAGPAQTNGGGGASAEGASAGGAPGAGASGGGAPGAAESAGGTSR
ncbi:MAG: tyrosinase family protein [Solirubrobacterales bacterium]|nr:tyrosinase family protein [Solirubrobacterales bacterium]